MSRGSYIILDPALTDDELHARVMAMVEASRASRAKGEDDVPREDPNSHRDGT